MSSQLSLGIRLRDDATLNSFYPGRNQELLEQLTNTALGRGEPYLLLTGSLGSGKTHLLQGACLEAHNENLRSLYISFAASDVTIQMLEGLETLNLVCFDDLECIVGDTLMELAVLECIGKLHSAGVNVIVAMQGSPSALAFINKELQQRLSFGISYKVQPLLAPEMVYALRLRAHARGIELPENVSKYLANNAKDMKQLYDYLSLLDEQSLLAKKKINLKLAKDIVTGVSEDATNIKQQAVE